MATQATQVIHISTIGARDASGVRAPRPVGRCRVHGKQQYASQRDSALAAAEFAAYNGWRPGGVYECPACSCWHLTSHQGG